MALGPGALAAEDAVTGEVGWTSAACGAVEVGIGDMNAGMLGYTMKSSCSGSLL